MKIVFATHNQHKVKEVDALLKSSGITFLSLVDVGITDDIIEDGATMEENAWIKTDFVFQKLGVNVMADDSGLEVDALNGAPGIISARYAGPEKDSDMNIDKVLEELGDNKNRGAQFRSVLAVNLAGNKLTFEGIVRGKLTKQRRGTGGFGYDPIFVPDGYVKTFGELNPSIKNSISHRARAFESLKEYLNSQG